MVKRGQINIKLVRALGLFLLTLFLLIYINDEYKHENFLGNRVVILTTTFATQKQKSSAEIKLANLSKVFQTELAKLQNSSNCNAGSILCGHKNVCGLGCQIHHRIGCLIISYAMKLPLIHDQRFWTYRKSWNETFYHLGSSSCSPGPSTIFFRWNCSRRRSKTEEMKYPLGNGIPIPRYLAVEVEKIHPDPFLWWIGQFMEFGLRLLPSEMKIVTEARNSIDFLHPIVGVHVRRTDKAYESGSYTHHKLEDYFTEAEKYFQNLAQSGVHFSVKRVFVASDDQSILSLAKQKYQNPEWEVIGYNHGETFSTQSSRVNSLQQIIKDLYTLVECDFIVCGHSSNLCSLLLEMLNIRHLNGTIRLKSLDDKYTYNICGSVRTIPLKINKV